MSVAGYDKKHLDHLKRQLVAGSIAYDKLVREHGVVLCDYEYNINTSNGDATATDKRLTDYKVGDSIEVISREADAQVTKDIRAVKQAMDKKQQEPDEKADPKIIKNTGIRLLLLSEKRDTTFRSIRRRSYGLKRITVIFLCEVLWNNAKSMRAA